MFCSSHLEISTKIISRIDWNELAELAALVYLGSTWLSVLLMTSEPPSVWQMFLFCQMKAEVEHYTNGPAASATLYKIIIAKHQDVKL